MKCIRHSFLDEAECPEPLWRLFELEVKKIVQLFKYLREKSCRLTNKLQLYLIRYGGAFPKKFGDIRSKYFVASDAELLLQLKSSIRFIKAFKEEQQGFFTSKNIEVVLRSLWKFVFVVNFNKDFSNQFSESLKFLFSFKDVKHLDKRIVRIRLKAHEQELAKPAKKFEKIAIGAILSASLLFFFVKLD